MAKHLPANTMAHTKLVAPKARVIHYPDPATRTADPARYTRPAMAARRAEQQALYARWLVWQAAAAERDRKVRRFWLGFGAVVGTAVLAAVAMAGWLVWHAITATGLGVLAAPLVVVVLAGLVVGGRRCITIVQHWH